LICGQYFLHVVGPVVRRIEKYAFLAQGFMLGSKVSLQRRGELQVMKLYMQYKGRVQQNLGINFRNAADVRVK
jgi:hypothetical protein